MSYTPNLSLKMILMMMLNYMRQLVRPVFVGSAGRVNADVATVSSVTSVTNVVSIGENNASPFLYCAINSNWFNSQRSRIV